MRTPGRVLSLLAFLAAFGGLFVMNSLTADAGKAERLIKRQTEVSTPVVSSETQTFIPVVMYHYIHDHFAGESGEGKNLTVSPKSFEYQLKWFSDNGYESISLDDLMAIRNGTKTSPKKPFIITFDDGYEDAYWNVLPLLQKYKFTGTFYIIATKVGKKGYMNKDQIKKLDEAGMTIGSHTMYHVNLPKVSARYAKYEIEQAKKDLEKMLGKPVPHFCYPYGGHNDAVVQQVKDAGYLTATTTVDGLVLPADDLFTLPRMRMMEATDPAKSIKDLLALPLKKR